MSHCPKWGHMPTPGSVARRGVGFPLWLKSGTGAPLPGPKDVRPYNSRALIRDSLLRKWGSVIEALGGGFGASFHCTFIPHRWRKCVMLEESHSPVTV